MPRFIKLMERVAIDELIQLTDCYELLAQRMFSLQNLMAGGGRPAAGGQVVNSLVQSAKSTVGWNHSGITTVGRAARDSIFRRPIAG